MQTEIKTDRRADRLTDVCVVSGCAVFGRTGPSWERSGPAGLFAKILWAGWEGFISLLPRALFVCIVRVASQNLVFRSFCPLGIQVPFYGIHSPSGVFMFLCWFC